MSLYVDSANLDEIRNALDCGWVYGITTNPILLSRETDSVEAHLEKLAQFRAEEIYYQVQALTAEAMQEEAEWARKILGDKLVVKIPPVREGFRFTSLKGAPWKTCITAVYSAAQALAASQAGAEYIAVYYSRMEEKEAVQAIGEMRAAIDGTRTQILAASLKSNWDISRAMKAGAQHFTLPYTVLLGMLDHPKSAEAVAAFQEQGLFLGS